MNQPQGWIPPSARDRHQLFLTDFVEEQIGTFEDRMEEEVELPERVILADLERAATPNGSLLPRVFQQTGSCVGASAGRAYSQAICGDVVHRGDREAVKLPFFPATYGVGRKIAGMNRPGDGSFGAAQAEAVKHDVFGMLPWDDKRVPKYTIVPDGKNAAWIKYTEAEERQWSHPSAWPVERKDLEADSKKFGMHTVSRGTTTNGMQQAAAQGFGITMASMYGAETIRVVKGVLLAKWDWSWAHQMSVGGYWVHPELGLIWLIDNQWFATIHGDCPVLEPMGIRGSFWMPGDDMERNISMRDTEVEIHSGTGGFPVKAFDWGKDNLGIVYED